jgi:SET domain-containing protein
LIGKGLLADQDIKKGTFIIEYTGEFIDKEEMVERMKKKKKDDHFYILYVDVNRYVDAEFKGNHSKYM